MSLPNLLGEEGADDERGPVLDPVCPPRFHTHRMVHYMVPELHFSTSGVPLLLEDPFYARGTVMNSLALVCCPTRALFAPSFPLKCNKNGVPANPVLAPQQLRALLHTKIFAALAVSDKGFFFFGPQIILRFASLALQPVQSRRSSQLISLFLQAATNTTEARRRDEASCACMSSQYISGQFSRFLLTGISLFEPLRIVSTSLHMRLGRAACPRLSCNVKESSIHEPADPQKAWRLRSVARGRTRKSKRTRIYHSSPRPQTPRVCGLPFENPTRTEIPPPQDHTQYEGGRALRPEDSAKHHLTLTTLALSQNRLQQD